MKPQHLEDTVVEDDTVFKGRDFCDQSPGEFILPPRSSRRRRRSWRSRFRKALATVGFFALIIILAVGLAAPERLDDCDGFFQFEADSPCAEPLFDFWDWIVEDR